MVGVVNSIEFLRLIQPTWEAEGQREQRVFVQLHWPAVFSFNASSVVLVVHRNQVAEGLMQIQDDHSEFCAEGTRGRLVCVSYLEVAPWSKQGHSKRRFGGLGSLLLRVASAWSEQRDLLGVVGLHALSGAEEFYQPPGFDQPRCPKEHHELYFELNATTAAEFRSKGGITP